jgi:CHAT domain-containing protein
MKAFYAHHLRGRLEPGAALARAQEWLRDLTSKDVVAELGAPVATVGADPEHPFSEPFYWAPFRINGL